LFRTAKSFSSTTTLFAPIAAGLLVAQAIGTAFVYRSNTKLQAALTAIDDAGYFAVPNPIVAEHLGDILPALCGGLFYTLSIGTGLTLATWAAMRLWQHTLGRRPRALTIMALAWLALVAGVNLKGPTWIPTLFCGLVPLATAWATAWGHPQSRNHGKTRPWIPVITLVLLSGLWATQLDRQLFVSIRDHVLLSNPAGRAVNDFYYRYTLHAAEAFKSFGQKTLRTAHVQGIDPTHPKYRAIESGLARNDVLLTAGLQSTDIDLVVAGNAVQLHQRGRVFIHTTLADFLSNPAKALQTFSLATDRLAGFRKLILVGLLLGFPILLYILVYGAVMTAITRILVYRKAVVAASGLCLAVGILLFLPMLKARPIPLATDTLEAALSAPHWSQRVAALRHITHEQIDISRFSQHLDMVNSPHILERYWLARALAASRSPSAHSQLIHLTRDPHPNVVCQAYHALGQRGRRSAVGLIQSQMRRSNHWYTQWYGYRALRKLGWHQTTSR
jgi:hypothetical protein